MMVHPSNLTNIHERYYNWLQDTREAWKQILELPDSDPDKKELIDDFRLAYADLYKTVGDTLPPFEQLSSNFLLALRNTSILLVNAKGGKTPVVEWNSNYGWILVGGDAMDRGFTVEGLTVTYMPRNLGSGIIDTVQQRARFFGYKKNYFPLCRVYLESDVIYAFRHYVEHEENMRNSLKEIRNKGKTLNEWKRAFILDPDLQPCRKNVLEFGYIRVDHSGKWVYPQMVLCSELILAQNQRIAKEFVNNINFREMEGHEERTGIQRHQVATDLFLRDVMEKLIVPIRTNDSKDSEKHIGLLLQLRHALDDNLDEYCTVYRMSSGKQRLRSINSKDMLPQLFQGEHPVNPPQSRGNIYPGDRKIKAPNQVSVQIHYLKLEKNKKVIQRDVPVLAVWVPTRLGVGLIYQVNQ